MQAVVLPIADRHAGAAERAAQALRDAGVRAEVDARTESVGRKIRDAELRKVPFMLVMGDREAEEGAVAVRRHGARDGRSPWPTSSRGWPRRSRRAAERRGTRRLARAPGGATRA